MKTLFAIAALLTCGSLHAAEEAAESPAMELLDLIDFDQTSVDSAMTVFEPYARQMEEQGLPPAATKEIMEEARQMYGRVFSAPDTKRKMAGIYEKHFTRDELRELVRFYGTPLGKKTLETLPQILADSAKVGEEIVLKEMPDFQEKIARIVEKHRPPAEKEDQE